MDEAYDYQLLLKHVFESGVNYAPKQEVVYRDLKRFTKTLLRELTVSTVR